MWVGLGKSDQLWEKSWKLERKKFMGNLLWTGSNQAKQSFVICATMPFWVVKRIPSSNQSCRIVALSQEISWPCRYHHVSRKTKNRYRIFPGALHDPDCSLTQDRQSYGGPLIPCSNIKIITRSLHHLTLPHRRRFWTRWKRGFRGRRATAETELFSPL